MTIAVGDDAPDFELRDQHGQPVKLSDFRGEKAVVVVFYPLTFTGVCTSEMCEIRDTITAYRNDQVETLAISVDSVPTHKHWADEQGFAFPLLSDFWPHGAVAAQYGVLNEHAGIAERGTFIVDKEGTVIYTDHNAIPDARDQEAWRSALTRIGAV